MPVLRVVTPALLAVAFLLSGLPAGAPPASATSERAAVVAFARAQIGKPWSSGANGLKAYDCSGLVYRTFLETGLLDRVGGKRRSASGFYTWFAERGRITSNPQPGDLVAYGNPVGHIGIYTGVRDGHPMAVSALTTGVKEHRVHGLTSKLRAYLAVNLDGSVSSTSSSSTTSSSTTTAAVTTTDALPAPFSVTMRLRKGSHPLYRLDSSGNVLEQRTIQRSTALTVNVDPDIKTYGGRPYARILSGTWSGWWRIVPGAGPSCCLVNFSPQRILRLGSGTHLFKSFHDGTKVIIRRHVRLDRTTYLYVDQRADFNGNRHFRIAGGAMAGFWVARTTNSQLVP